MLKADEILERAQQRMPRQRGINCTIQATLSEDIAAITRELVDDVNAELEVLRALIRPGSTLEQQIEEREAERAELLKLEEDERRDAIAASMEYRT